MKPQNACMVGFFGSVTCLDLCVMIGTKNPVVWLACAVLAVLGGMLVWHFAENGMEGGRE